MFFFITFNNEFLFSSLSYRRPAESPTRRRKRRPSPPATRPELQRTWRWPSSEWDNPETLYNKMTQSIDLTLHHCRHRHHPVTFSSWRSIGYAPFHRPAGTFIAFKEHCIHVFGENKSCDIFFFTKCFVLFTPCVYVGLINLHVLHSILEIVMHTSRTASSSPLFLFNIIRFLN